MQHRARQERPGNFNMTDLLNRVCFLCAHENALNRQEPLARGCLSTPQQPLLSSSLVITWEIHKMMEKLQARPAGLELAAWVPVNTLHHPSWSPVKTSFGWHGAPPSTSSSHTGLALTVNTSSSFCLSYQPTLCTHLSGTTLVPYTPSPWAGNV
jgi:hypothetical protein